MITPFYLAVSMSETNLSSDWVKKQKEIYGHILSIEKIVDPIRVGIPDIFAIYKGMPVFAEAKKINEISLINNHEFSTMQLRNLRIKSKAGAISIGLLIKNINEIKFMYFDQLKHKITKEDYLNAEVFNWETLRSVWLKRIIHDH